MMSRRLALSASAMLLVVGGVAVAGPATAATTPQSLADAQGRDIGFALSPARLSEPAYRAIADGEFNLAVAENAMKWDAVEPVQGQFRWTDADAVASYAAGTGKKLYGHPLVWHSQLPGWVGGLSADAPGPAMRNHVTTVMSRYHGTVTAWDVVNEAFNDDGTRRTSVFQTKLGDSWIADAFRTARAADPAAKLCINDYSIEGVNPRSTAIYNLVRDLKAQGVPIDCVGFQSHLIVGQVPGDMQRNLQRFADLRVDVRITELDIRMPLPADGAKLARQAADYRQVTTICLAVARCRGVTVWGITDRYSWIPDVFPGQGAALIWDDNYAAKPAYDAVAAALGAAGPTSPAPSSPAPSSPTPGSPAPTASVPPPPGSLTPSNPGQAFACRVTYRITSQWPTGFTAAITVANTGPETGDGWQLAFAFTGGQTVTQAWNTEAARNGAQVNLINAPWNAAIPAGGSVSLGFNATHTGTNPVPAACSLNGTPCTTG